MFKRLIQLLPVGWWRGASVTLITWLLLISLFLGGIFPAGFPLILKCFVGLIAGALVIVIALLLVSATSLLIKKFPVSFIVVLISCVILIVIMQAFLPLPGIIYYPLMLAFAILVILIGGSIATKRTENVKRFNWMMFIPLILFFALISWCLVWLNSKGDDEIKSWDIKRGTSKALALSLENPATNGAFEVTSLYYGSGKNKRRQTYDKDATLITPTVDATTMLPEWKGFTKMFREWYWGYGVSALPLNAQVWYPKGEGKFPLALIVHGNHDMEEFSEPGYEYLGKLLASRGFILVSVDENFLNASWSGDFKGKEMQVRGWLLLEHLNQWKEWNADSKNIFYNKVDLDKVVLMGHSRGGEAIAIAAAFNELDYYPDQADIKFDYHFGIKGLVSIAPTDRRYSRRIRLKNINYLTLQGGLDNDEPSFFGMRQAERIAFSDSGYHFRAGLYVPGANHGQFNSVWKTDAGIPFKWLLNTRPLISESDQEEFAKVYISGFLETVLNDKKDYLPMFQNAAYAQSWLPKLEYLNKFEDSKTLVLAGYEEDIDLTTGTKYVEKIEGKNLKLWKETELVYRNILDKQGSSAVMIGWKKDSARVDAPTYSIALLALPAIEAGDYLVISLSDGDLEELKKLDKPEMAMKSEDTKGIETEKDENNKVKSHKMENESVQENDKKRIQPDFTIELHDEYGNMSSVLLSEVVDLLPRWEINHLKLDHPDDEGSRTRWEATLGDYEIPIDAFRAKNRWLNLEGLRNITIRFDQTDQGVMLMDKIGFRKKPPQEGK